jgi:hypothetical protein
MRDLLDLAAMTGPEAFVVGLTMALCVIGLMLPKFGNAIGRSVLGEDPVVRRWRDAWASRRDARRAERVARKADKRAARARRRDGHAAGEL